MEEQEMNVAILPAAAVEADGPKAEKGEETELTATRRTAYVRLRNFWGSRLVAATVRHRYADNPDWTEEKTWNFVPPLGETSPSDRLTVTYWTGAGTHNDYWWVSIQLDNGDVYVSKGSFYCYLTAGDENGVVWAVVDGQSSSLRIQPPSSGSCVTNSMTKQ